jgi:3-hydroxypropanoate dehydrogenase
MMSGNMAQQALIALPARVVFVRSEEGKAKLLPHLMGGNQEKTKSAAVCAIIGHDVKFYDRIPELFPHQPEAREWFLQ